MPLFLRPPWYSQKYLGLVQNMFGSKIGLQKEFDLMVSNQVSKKKHASLILAVYETMKTQIHGMSIE